MNCRKYIIVTGGTGFIGSCLLAKLEEEGYDNIICIDNFEGNKWINVAHRNICIRYFLPHQIEKVLFDYCNQICAIIHLGGISTTTESNVNKIVTTNIQLSLLLYDYCNKYKIQFIYASSASTYGDGKFGFEDNESLEYLGQLKPLNPYAWSKLCIDKYIFRNSNGILKDFQTVGLRFFNVYGPNEYHKGTQASVLFHFFNQLKSTKEIKLFASNNPTYKDGEQNRDFVHVDDCTNVIIWFLRNPNISGIFNVGTGTSTTFNKIAALVINRIDKSGIVSYVNIPNNIAVHYQNHTLANIKKLRSVGYKNKFISIEEGLISYIDKLNSSDIYL